MSFLLRATLVIGALSYLAATRGQPGPTTGAPDASPIAGAIDAVLPALAKGSTSIGSTSPATAGPVAAAWNALPTDARQRLAQEAVAELGRRIGPATASRDTLAEADRKAAWRGTEGR